jgi:3-phosphoshikimate 1-carboxyvinyltransferase
MPDEVRPRTVDDPDPDAVSFPDPLLVEGERFLGGRIAPPPSKSYSHRALNLAWLAGEPRTVRSLLDAEDTQLFRRALATAGWQVSVIARGAGSVDLELIPPESAVSAGAAVTIDCGNAGTMFRFLTATLCVVPGRWVLDGTPRLRERPVGPLVEALRQLGGRIEWCEEPGFAPLKIRGESLRGGDCSLDAGASSQYLSAILMAGAFTPQPVDLTVRALTSQPYVEVTLDAMRVFGVDAAAQSSEGFRILGARPRDTARVVRVEADDSAAAYPAAAAMITGRPVELVGLRRDSIQGDRRFLDVLVRMGAHLEWLEDGALRVSGRVDRAVEVDMSSMPDQVPTLAAVACFARGRTVITNAAHLRIKESDRLEAMATELGKAGVDVEERPDGLEVQGDPNRLEAWRSSTRALIDPRADHRIAMSLALVGLKRRDLWVRDPGTVGKSYPLFWHQMFGIG